MVSVVSDKGSDLLVHLYRLVRVMVKVKVSHSLIAIGAVGVRVSLYLGHS